VGVSLDTSVLIDVLRGDRRTISELDRLEARGLVPVLSTVAVFEVLSRVEFTRSRSERARIEVVLRQVPIQDFNLDAARCAGELRAELQRAGASPGAPDVMIAGHALAAGHTLVTRDRALGAAGRILGLVAVTL
jgi:tRNA(fMet)-specific endonuclease VapC